MREASGTSGNLASLPSGGGGIAPLGDRFQPDLVRGSGSYAVPIHLPKGPNELQPSLSLTYSTGSGNGPFGFGWRLDCLRIERRSDRGVPRYTEDDTFVLGEAEVLIPVGGNRYRTRTDNMFWFIERFGDGWRLRTGDGRTLLLGQTPASREFDGTRVFAWHLDEMRDPAGNSVAYTYQRDGNRLLLAEIRYSIFSLRVKYEPRPDVLRNGRAGFERVTALRATALELHCQRLAPTLMRTYALSYEQALNGASQLTRLSLRAEENGQSATFPDLTFAYSTLDLDNWRVREIESDIAPPSLDDRTAQLVDLTADALPDILQTSSGRMRLWRNRGGGRLEGPTELEAVPSTVVLERENVAFADLDGNGRVDLFAANQPLELAFESNGKGGFKPQPLVFAQRTTLQLSSPTTRLMDVDGDGVTDLLQTGRSHFLTSRHKPGSGWEEPESVRRIADLEQFPDVTFGDRGVRLADMSGDGLQDMVVVQSGNVCYWPALGQNAWGRRVEMELPPVFPRGYREDRLVVADVDGDGCADIIYFDADRTLVWINQCGAKFAPPVELPIAPVGSARPRPVDFFGDGRVSFVWTAPSRHALDCGWRCLRFDDGRKPYLMTRVRNGMGGESEMEYSTSTEMRQLDEEVGRDWQHELPIVVHVVRGIRQRDTITGRETSMTMRYHDGVYDGPEREFRGFVEASVESAGDDSVPTTRQEVAFFQGEPEHDDLVERERQRALAGALLTTKTFEQTTAGEQLRQESAQIWAVREEFDGAAGRVWFPHVTQIEARENSPSGAPARLERTQLVDFDEFGNPARRLRESLAEGAPPAQTIRSEERFTYTRNQTEWLVKLPVRAELRDAAGVPVAVQIRFYDGEPFVGRAEGQAVRGLMTRALDARLLDERLPSNYKGARDFAALGFTRLTGGDTAGWYATTLSVQRDARGNPIEQRDAMGRPIRVTFDADGVYPVRTSDARGKETTQVFNPRAGEPSQVTLPDGRVVRYEHDPIGRLVATFETDDAGVEQLTKCWLLDLGSLPVSVTSVAPAGTGRTRAEFLPPADLASVVDASVSRMFYDGFGTELLEVATGPDGPGGARRFVASRRTQLNAKGTAAVQFPPIYVTDLAFTPAPVVDDACVRQRYDAGGNVTETSGPGPAHFRVVRDTFTIEHFEGGGADPVRVEHFDSRGRLVRIDEMPGGAAAAIKTSYDLTLDGRIEGIRDDAGKVAAQYTFAGPSEAIRINHRDVGTRAYYRNAAGHVVERVEVDGSRLFYTHDTLGRVTTIEHAASASGTRQVIRQVFYDEDPGAPSAGRFLEGRVALVREAGNETRLSYNRAGRTVREAVTVSGETLVTQRIYDLQGRTTAIVYPDNRRVDYTLDRSGSVRGIAGVLDSVAYGADGAVEGYRLANGVDISMPYDPVSRRLTQAMARRGTTTLRRIDYEYAPVGTIEMMRDQMPSDTEQQRFTYDGLYRISGFTVRQNNEAGALLRKGSYTCDAAGNLRTYGDTQALTLRYTAASQPGRVTSTKLGSTTTPVRYNSRGHIRAFNDLTEITYDPHDRVESTTKADGTTLRFAYDIESRRIMKETIRGGMTVARVLYAAGLFERHAGRVIRHIYLGKRLVASESVTTDAAPVTTPAYYLSDHHGTVLLSTDASGNIVHQQRYSPYGASLRSVSALDRYLGRQRDAETGLIQLGVRYYAPALGRFISPDWFVLENPKKPARLPQGYNLYSYALNNPLSFRDPSGMFIFAVLAAIAIVAAVASVAAFAVGFVSGLVYGLANGQGWGSLLTALEAGLTTVAGMWLGAIAGGAAGFLIGGPAGMLVGAVIGGLMGGMNGLISGVHGIYDWTSIDGWFAFLSDSTWSLLGTTLGNVVHIINLFYSDSNYRHDLSHRENRHVYEGGFALKQDFAFTMGNVISNAGQGGKGINAAFIANHEELHIWQQRFFGPLFQATYVVWGVGGFIVASVYWLFNTDEDWGSLVETAAYYDNPFEYWAYNNDSNWPPSGVNSELAWG